MTIRKTISFAAFSLLTFTAGLAFAGPAATIDELSWMAGSWAVALGPNTLEENWITPKDGAIASMVRMSGNGTTSMYEVIVIEEKEGSLEMSIQQWGPGFAPMAEEAQKMELTEIGDKMVKFTAITEGPMSVLEYRRPTDSTFTISLGAGDPITLEAQ